MNFRNPFKSLDKADDERNRHKKLMNKQISSKALEITKKVATRQPCMKEVSELEKLYKEYFKKFPDVEAELRASKRIAQLKTICK